MPLFHKHSDIMVENRMCNYLALFICGRLVRISFKYDVLCKKTTTMLEKNLVTGLSVFMQITSVTNGQTDNNSKCYIS